LLHANDIVKDKSINQYSWSAIWSKNPGYPKLLGLHLWSNEYGFKHSRV